MRPQGIRVKFIKEVGTELGTSCTMSRKKLVWNATRPAAARAPVQNGTPQEEERPFRTNRSSLSMGGTWGTAPKKTRLAHHEPYITPLRHSFAPSGPPLALGAIWKKKKKRNHGWCSWPRSDMLRSVRSAELTFGVSTLRPVRNVDENRFRTQE
jgi:hypothetical protein